jgi:hypothetical protein
MRHPLGILCSTRLELKRYVDNGVAAWPSGINRNDHTLDVFAEHWPLRVAKHDEGYSAKR